MCALNAVSGLLTSTSLAWNVFLSDAIETQKPPSKVNSQGWTAVDTQLNRGFLSSDEV